MLTYTQGWHISTWAFNLCSLYRVNEACCRVERFYYVYLKQYNSLQSCSWCLSNTEENLKMSNLNESQFILGSAVLNKLNHKRCCHIHIHQNIKSLKCFSNVDNKLSSRTILVKHKRHQVDPLITNHYYPNAITAPAIIEKPATFWQMWQTAEQTVLWPVDSSLLQWWGNCHSCILITSPEP